MKGYTSRKYAGIPLGLTIQKQIAKTWIFRIRKGHGFYGTKVGELIQDKFAYFVPASINNVESAASRTKWAAAVSKWRTVLTPAEKKEYNRRVTRSMHMSGYNLFMREEMLA